MHGLVIREALIKDMSEVMSLIGQSDMSPDNSLSESEVEDLFQRITETPFHRLFVVELNSEIVGTFALVIVQQLSHNAARSVVIEDIVVRTDYQGRGVGKKIMKFASSEAQSLGCYKMILSSGIAREQAHAFYESLGFKKDGLRFALSLRD